MVSSSISFDTLRANVGLALYAFAPIAGGIAAQTVMANRFVFWFTLSASPTKPAEQSVDRKAAQRPVKSKPTPPKRRSEFPAKIETTVYQSKTNSGKSGAVTLAAMPMPKSKLDIQ